ncbi:hypothetical protein TNCV_5070681 [Trichonephila clavipes]|nr:hypothetical protein TNCV_5070681 [Trichonephila clavipes]
MSQCKNKAEFVGARKGELGGSGKTVVFIFRRMSATMRTLKRCYEKAPLAALPTFLVSSFRSTDANNTGCLRKVLYSQRVIQGQITQMHYLLDIEKHL